MIVETINVLEATSYFWKHSRRITYNNWPFKESDNCSADCMAAAGFYVIGNDDEPDLVECFICGKQLNGWEPSDDPWEEHEKHQSKCPFVKLNKPNEMDWTVEELYDMYKQYKMKEYVDKLNKEMNMVKDEMIKLTKELYDCKKSQKNKSN
ncbi:hypothetical protein PUN28_009119 [Cardiocondyla obscurior]|uniref:Baculoviral IAP repeat-containing protein 5 n=1 Tax=Cardiocondyla obscurior TaxID=286306 RepID=A0AAW2FW40_9HYME